MPFNGNNFDPQKLNLALNLLRGQQPTMLAQENLNVGNRGEGQMLRTQALEDKANEYAPQWNEWRQQNNLPPQDIPTIMQMIEDGWVPPWLDPNEIY